MEKVNEREQNVKRKKYEEIELNESEQRVLARLKEDIKDKISITSVVIAMIISYGFLFYSTYLDFGIIGIAGVETLMVVMGTAVAIWVYKAEGKLLENDEGQKS